MKNKKRFIIRTLTLIILFSTVAYAIYIGAIKKENNTITEGDLSPNFVLNSINNEKIELNKIKKKGIILNFWGTWCEPCQREMPAFESFYQKNKNNGIEIISINSQESNIAVKNFIKEKQLSFPVVIDTDGQVGNTYNVTTLPATFLIDSKGKIIKKHAGEMNEEMLQQWIKYLN
ncbi:thiol-disulfide oxidoreductase ResA [Bacillus mycoides]|uniref:thiol-disulfide oxidoreductase ResA n=1 Tax=Bacillus mycoides TaxID=1405 RepID=UPI003D0649C1